jgi:hypothetical protein
MLCQHYRKKSLNFVSCTIIIQIIWILVLAWIEQFILLQGLKSILSLSFLDEEWYLFKIIKDSALSDTKLSRFYCTFQRKRLEDVSSNNQLQYLQILITFEGLVTKRTCMRSKVTMSNTVGSKCAVSGIHSSTYTAWELYASVIILMAIEIRLRFKSALMKIVRLEHTLRPFHVTKKIWTKLLYTPYINHTHTSMMAKSQYMSNISLWRYSI